MLPQISAVVVVVLVLGIVLMLAYLQWQARKRAWGEFASQTGLTCNVGQFPWSPNMVHGDYQGHPLTLDTYTRRSGKNSTTYTRMLMEVNSPAGLKFDIWKESVIDKVGKQLGAQDIATGDEELDRRLVMKGQPEEAVRQVFASGAIRQPLLSTPDLSISLAAGEVISRKRGVESDPERLRKMADLLGCIAEEIERLR